MAIHNRPIPSIQQVQSEQLKGKKTNRNKSGQSEGFSQIFKQQLQHTTPLKFSKHADARLQLRNIHLTHAQLERLQQGVDEAKTKGVKDSLMLMDDLAFVVNVKNNTVVTALDKIESKKHVFTNIDGAVLV